MLPMRPMRKFGLLLLLIGTPQLAFAQIDQGSVYPEGSSAWEAEKASQKSRAQLVSRCGLALSLVGVLAVAYIQFKTFPRPAVGRADMRHAVELEERFVIEINESVEAEPTDESIELEMILIKRLAVALYGDSLASFQLQLHEEVIEPLKEAVSSILEKYRASELDQEEAEALVVLLHLVEHLVSFGHEDFPDLNQRLGFEDLSHYGTLAEAILQVEQEVMDIEREDP